MKKRAVKKVSMDILYEMAGSFLIGLAIYNFALPSGFPMAGVFGGGTVVFPLSAAPPRALAQGRDVPGGLFWF